MYLRLPIIFLLLFSSLQAQHSIFVNAGTRVKGFPTQNFSTRNGTPRQVILPGFIPGIKMGVGIHLPTEENLAFELEWAYSLNPVKHSIFQRYSNNSTPPSYSTVQTDYTGFDLFAELSTRFSRKIGAEKKAEILMGIRFPFFYVDGRGGGYQLETYELRDNPLGSPTYVLIDEFDYYNENSRPTFIFEAWPELGARFWCLNKGLSGFQCVSGISMSSIFSREDKIVSYTIGIGYIRRWDKKRKRR